MNRPACRDIDAARAAAAVGPISKGMEAFGLSGGRFSLVELLEHCLQATGPADVTLTLWTFGLLDLRRVGELLASGAIRSARWLLDRATLQHHPHYMDALRALVGDERIAVTRVHAKWVTIRNASWALAIRTSANLNLNLNRRSESWEVSDDPALTGWLEEVADLAFADPDCAVARVAADPDRLSLRTLTRLGGPVEWRPLPITYGEPGERGISYE